MQYNYIICIILSHIYAFVYTYFENNLNFFVGNGSFFYSVYCLYGNFEL